MCQTDSIPELADLTSYQLALVTFLAGLTNGGSLMLERMTRLDQQTLERLIEAYGLNAFLENVSAYCVERAANHLRYKETECEDWNRAATNLMVCAEFCFRRRMTISRAENKSTEICGLCGQTKDKCYLACTQTYTE